MNQQLDLFDLDGESRRQAQLDRDARRKALDAEWTEVLTVRPDAGQKLGRHQIWCGRCGQTHNPVGGSHDGGYTGCPIEHDPTWSKYPRRADGHGYHGGGITGHDGGSLLTTDELCDRWENQYFPGCECGHPRGLHVNVYGVSAYHTSCLTYCGCPRIQARVMNAPCRHWRTNDATPHEGHCCFSGPTEAYIDAVLPPCGHWAPAIELADITRQEVPSGT